MEVAVVRRRDVRMSDHHQAARLIPKRGQVKVAIVVSLYHSLFSVLSSIIVPCVDSS
ncbi:hypothetical protein HN51_013174 [Arachis hypogaea]